jgi:PAS domain S-box-containing protein
MSEPAPATPPPAAWQALAEAEGNALAWLDAGGQVRWCNAAFDAVAPAARARAIEQARAGARTLELASQDASGRAQRWRVHAAHLAGGELALVLRDVRDSAERLALENARLRELLDMAQEFGRLGVWERDPYTLEGRWDRHVFRFFGIGAADGATPHYAEAAARIDPADRLDETFRASLTQPGAYSSRYRVHHPDGSVRMIHSQWRVVADARGEPERVIGVMVDDTETHELARDAAATHAQLEMALSLAKIGTLRYDVASGLLHYDRRAQEVLGRSADEQDLAQEAVRDWIHPDDLPLVQAAFDETLTTGRPTDTQARYRHADGSWRSVMIRRVLQRDAKGKPLALLGVILDVTEQRETLQRLREAHERVTLAMSSVGMGTWEHDFASGQDTWDAQMYALRGLPPQARALDAAERLALVHPDDREGVVLASLPRLREAAPLAYDFRVVWPDGSVHWLASRSTPLLDDAGRVVRRIGVNWDITEAKTVEQAQREREIALRESQAKSQFMARMSHELRTPLNAILGFSQLLLAANDAGDRATQREKLEKVQGAGRQLLSLVDGVLELSGSPADAAPATPPAAPALDEPPSAAAPAAGAARPRVLYIEDNAVNMMILRELLAQRERFEFHGAQDGSSGVAMARALQPALVLIDMQLPDFDGIEVLRRLRADPATAHLICVALSANAMPDDVQRAHQAGFADYWTKPVDLIQFNQALDRLVPAGG